MKKKYLFSMLLSVSVISLLLIANLAGASDEEVPELPKVDDLTAEEFIEICKFGSAKIVKDLLTEKNFLQMFN